MSYPRRTTTSKYSSRQPKRKPYYGEQRRPAMMHEANAATDDIDLRAMEARQRAQDAVREDDGDILYA